MIRRLISVMKLRRSHHQDSIVFYIGSDSPVRQIFFRTYPSAEIRIVSLEFFVRDDMGRNSHCYKQYKGRYKSCYLFHRSAHLHSAKNLIYYFVRRIHLFSFEFRGSHHYS